MANYLFEVFVYRSLISQVLRSEPPSVLHKTPEKCNFLIHIFVLPTFIVILGLTSLLLTHTLCCPHTHSAVTLHRFA